ncbi:hypothetical protein BO221_14015 [Archangium sp. Cb G35]|uniref:hypothetical protein n=1 Tax=Archangium sp. Cb G35 TaxID=1920190 RepID=UPI000935E2A5|nr:hypothetical protein [Archangium sp. Cb G35]OJT24287.1 hypothetical protein BO221_14015 [Archangium sp. Cb G35]
MAETLRYRCGNAGCDFSTDDAGDLKVHEITEHGLSRVEVHQEADAPLPSSVTFPPLEQFERGLAQLRCERSGGHVPSLRTPGVCCSCLASLEVSNG